MYTDKETGLAKFGTIVVPGDSPEDYLKQNAVAGKKVIKKRGVRNNPHNSTNNGVAVKIEFGNYSLDVANDGTNELSEELYQGDWFFGLDFKVEINASERNPQIEKWRYQYTGQTSVANDGDTTLTPYNLTAPINLEERNLRLQSRHKRISVVVI